jgi:putative copper resistance protein D
MTTIELLLDIFGYLTVVLSGAIVALQAAVIGGVAFLALLACPHARLFATDALTIKAGTILAYSAFGLAAALAVSLALHATTLAGTISLTPAELVGAGSVIAGLARIAAALAIGLTARHRPNAPALFALVVVLMSATLATSHAAARLDMRLPLLAATLFHVLGASVWIGGLPYFLAALRGTDDGASHAWIGRRFSLISMTGVAMLSAGAAGLAFAYIARPEALYGTSYGLMVTGKAILFVGLLLLGLGNYRLVERLRRDPATPVARLRRFAEVEIGVGIVVFFTAASITSLPPAVDIFAERVSWAELIERMTPAIPRLSSPDHGDLAIPALQARLDAEAKAAQTRAGAAFVPGGGEMPPRNAFDIAWSEYNHHWAGLFVLAVGLLCLIERSGHAPWARNWPLLFFVLAGFLFWRSDPEAWPIGQIGFFDSLRDPEIVQHRLAVLVVLIFGLFEWGVRTGRIRTPAAAIVFPLAVGIGATLLLTHSHAIANVKEQLLIEASHLPMALLGIAAAAARWLELRLPTIAGQRAGLIWPLCFLAIGAILLAYREA